MTGKSDTKPKKKLAAEVPTPKTQADVGVGAESRNLTLVQLI